MKNYPFYKLLLFCLVLAVFSCKEKELYTSDQISGEYDAYTQVEDIYGNYADGRTNGASIERLDNNIVRIIVKEQNLTPTYGSLRSSTFERCSVVRIDTSGYAFQPFAKIIDNSTNTEIAQIYNFYKYWNPWNAAERSEPRIHIFFNYVNK